MHEMKLFKWQKGRQEGTEYEKFPLIFFKIRKVGIDGYVLRYQPYTTLKPHRDKIEGKHYRLNIELWGRGKFECEKIGINLFNRIYIFRPDINTHSMNNFGSTRHSSLSIPL